MIHQKHVQCVLCENNMILLVKDIMIQGTSLSKFKESFMKGIWMFKNIKGYLFS